GAAGEGKSRFLPLSLSESSSSGGKRGGGCAEETVSQEWRVQRGAGEWAGRLRGSATTPRSTEGRSGERGAVTADRCRAGGPGATGQSKRILGDRDERSARSTSAGPTRLRRHHGGRNREPGDHSRGC